MQTRTSGISHARTRGCRGLAALFLLLPTMAVLGAQAATPAAGAEVCPGEHIYPSDRTTRTLTYTAPAGYLVSGWCVKAGPTTDVHDASDGHGHALPAATVTIAHSTSKEISHYSVMLVKAPEGNPPTPPVIPPPTPPMNPPFAPTVVPPVVTPPVVTPPEVLPEQAFGKAVGSVKASCQGTVRARLSNRSGGKVVYRLRVGPKVHRIAVKSPASRVFVTHGRPRARVTLTVGSRQLDTLRIPALCAAPEVLPDTGVRATNR